MVSNFSHLQLSTQWPTKTSGKENLGGKAVSQRGALLMTDLLFAVSFGRILSKHQKEERFLCRLEVKVLTNVSIRFFTGKQDIHPKTNTLPQAIFPAPKLLPGSGCVRALKR